MQLRRTVFHPHEGPSLVEVEVGGTEEQIRQAAGADTPPCYRCRKRTVGVSPEPGEILRYVGERCQSVHVVKLYPGRKLGRWASVRNWFKRVYGP